MSESPGASIEDQLLDAANVDRDKITEFGKILFMLNGFRPGPLPDRYMVLCTKPGEEWCVAQLWADQEKPFRLVEGMRFSSSVQAESAALELRERAEAGRGEALG